MNGLMDTLNSVLRAFAGEDLSHTVEHPARTLSHEAAGPYQVTAELLGLAQLHYRPIQVRNGGRS